MTNAYWVWGHYIWIELSSSIFKRYRCLCSHQWNVKIRLTELKGKEREHDLPYWLGMTSGSVSSPSGGSWSLIIWWCRVSLLFTPVQLFPIDVARLLNCGDVVRVCCCFCSIWQSTAIVGSWVCLFDFKFSSTLLRNSQKRKENAKINDLIWKSKAKWCQNQLYTNLLACFRYTIANTIQTMANKIAAANVRPASTGDIGMFVKLDWPENGQTK